MAPKLDEVEGCLATGRGGIRTQVERLGVKDRTKADLYRALLKARRLIDRDLAEPLDVAALAKAAALSPAHFSRLFRKAFKATPHRYLRQRRVAMGRHLLKTTDDSITEIALRVGFETPSAFATAFKAETGKTPSAVRKAK